MSFIKEERIPDLILLDIEMPEYSGFDFLRDIEFLPSEIRSKIKIVILSSYTYQSTDPGQDLVIGALKKPLNDDNVADIQRLLNSDRLSTKDYR